MTTRDTESIAVTINGQARRAPAGMNVAELLRWLGVEPDRVAVELNRAIVRKPDWPTVMVEDGAQVEVVQFVGGG